MIRIALVTLFLVVATRAAADEPTRVGGDDLLPDVLPFAPSLEADQGRRNGGDEDA